MKHQILAVLTQGACYGLQIRNEIQRRLDREKPINVGQIYSTLDRLLRDELVEIQANTDDGLPLYSLTLSGERAVQHWFSQPVVSGGGAWESMVMQVVMAASLPGVEISALVRAYHEFWTKRLSVIKSTESITAAMYADELLATQALLWLSTFEHYVPAPVPVSQERPARGRPASRER